MRALSRGLAFLPVLVIAFSCQQPVVELTQADVEAINDLRMQYELAYNTRDLEGLMTLWADDAMRLPPNGPAVSGRDAIAEGFQTEFGEYTAEVSTSSEEVKGAGQWAFDRGSYSITVTPQAGGESIQENGKYLVICQRQADGSWKVSRIMWNENAPHAGMD